MLTDVDHPQGGMLAWVGIFFFILSSVRYFIARAQVNVPRRIYYINLIRGNVAFFFTGLNLHADEMNKTPHESNALSWFVLLCVGLYYVCSARGHRIRAERVILAEQIIIQQEEKALVERAKRDTTIWPPPPDL